MQIRRLLTINHSIPLAAARYHNQKWATERDVKDTYEGYDFPVIRYAEVLLNYTEAVYERYAATDGSITDESKGGCGLEIFE